MCLPSNLKQTVWLPKRNKPIQTTEEVVEGIGIGISTSSCHTVLSEGF
jgi:hypothetical protein